MQFVKFFAHFSLLLVENVNFIFTFLTLEVCEELCKTQE